MKAALPLAVCLVFTVIGNCEETAPCDWTLAVVPRLDWTAGEITVAREWLKAAKPDVVAAIGRPEWLDSAANAAGPPSVNLAPEVKAEREAGNDEIVLDRTKIVPVSAPGAKGRPLEIIRAATRRNRYGTININPVDVAEAIRKLGESAASNDADQVIILDDAAAAGALELEAIRMVTRPGTTAAIHLNAARLASDIPARPDHPRVPLIHMLTCRGADIEWHVFPITGEPAVHAERFPAAARADWYHHPKLTPDWQPPRIPHWIDAYVCDNPALFPHIGDAAKRPPARRLRWEHDDLGRGFPLFCDFEKRANSIDPSLPANLPGDVVRSPGSRFAYLPWSDKPEDGGDDGQGVDVVELKSGRYVQLYWIGVSGGKPLSATWFTDRYLLERRFSYDPCGGVDDRDDPGQFHTVENHALTLYDFVTGERFSLAGEDLDRRHGGKGVFRGKVFFPTGDATVEKGIRAVWDASQAAMDSPPAEAPVTVADACVLAGIPSAAAGWKKLGVWPPPENWRLLNARGGSVYPGVDDSGWKSMNESPLLERKDYPNNGGLIGWKIKSPRSGTKGKSGNQPPGDSPSVARTPLFATGMGCLPEMTAVRTAGEANRLTLIAGKAGFPVGREIRSGWWMLLLDSVSHQAWRVDFGDDDK
ncbi:MAG: hypothetical protein J0M04_03430 [Verrucomicrobia bacterium]|nr:hypothetical protein [Verrucomicrobiota bacterium]